MNKNYPLKKAKGIFIYDIHSNRYYDLRSNSNIIGHSCKALTTVTKNHISSRWNLLGDTVIHRRTRRLFEDIFSKEYYLSSTFSLTEFIHRLYNYSKEKKINIGVSGERFKHWFNENCNSIKTESKNDIIIYDMAELYLNTNGNHDIFARELHNLKKGEITIFNYFWYPELDIIPENADIIILPEIYSGGFDYLNILINKKSTLFPDSKYLVDELEEAIPTLYLASSMKQYHIIRRINTDKSLRLNWKDTIQTKRIFSFNKIDPADINELTKKYYEKNILLNNKPPYYNYLPLRLEDFQLKYLLRISI